MAIYNCRCDCGTERLFSRESLRSTKTKRPKNCGCKNIGGAWGSPQKSYYQKEDFTDRIREYRIFRDPKKRRELPYDQINRVYVWINTIKKANKAGRLNEEHLRALEAVKFFEPLPKVKPRTREPNLNI